MAYRSGKDEGEEWWRRRLGRLLTATDEQAVLSLLRYRPQGSIRGRAPLWRAWSVEKSWRPNAGPQVIVKAAGRRKNVDGVHACVRYIARLRQSDASPAVVFDEFGRTVAAMRALADWDLLSDADNLSKTARQSIDSGRGMPLNTRLHYVQLHHFVVSAGIAVTDTIKRPAFERGIHAAIDELFAKRGFRVLWALHDDAAFLHAHVAVAAASRFGERLRLDIRGEMFDHMRQVFAEAFNRAGLPTQAVRREDQGEIRRQIMTGETFARWPRGKGNGDLSVRAPVWFAAYGEGVVQRLAQAAVPTIQQPFWRRLFRARERQQVVASELALAHDRFSQVFVQPSHALQAWRDLARGENGQRGKALANWYLKFQPVAFGEIRDHGPHQRQQAVDAVKALPALSMLFLRPPTSCHQPAYRQIRRKNQAKKDRRQVVRSLWNLAGWIARAGLPASLAKTVLGKGLMSLDMLIKPPVPSVDIIPAQQNPVVVGDKVELKPVEPIHVDAPRVAVRPSPERPLPPPSNAWRRGGRGLG